LRAACRAAILFIEWQFKDTAAMRAADSLRHAARAGVASIALTSSGYRGPRSELTHGSLVATPALEDNIAVDKTVDTPWRA
jgi:hypothetical protein